MSKVLVLSLKNTITHNIAQQLVSGVTKDEMYDYLGKVAEYLFNDPVPQSFGIKDEDVHEIYLYALHHAQEEVEMITQMYERYGIKTKVEGHGGSAIHPGVMIETLLLKA